ncbi:MAG TPA: hypothetical protein VGR70_02275 [Stellaceae bacterium]|nr:hypothetical protein [Stellaceae bacterium]
MWAGLTTMAVLLSSLLTSAAMADSPPPPHRLFCTEQWQPVCGTVSGQRVTYSNRCFASIAGATEVADGECGPANGGPTKPK